MKPECLAAVAKAAGRKITQAESDAIEAKLSRAMRALAISDRNAFASLPPHERLAAAAKIAGDELVQESNLKQQRLEAQVKMSARISAYLRDQKTRGMNELESLKRYLVNTPDGKSRVTSVEQWAMAIKAEALRRTSEAFEAVDPRFWKFVENQEGVRTLTRELYGEHTGNEAARRAAEAFHQVANELRERFNRAGGVVPKREDWNIPQHHSQSKVAKAGFDEWSRAVFPNLNRRWYYNDDGTRMNDAQMLQFLQRAYESIATGGINTMVPGAEGRRMLSATGDEARQIHFKDADSYLRYQQQFGDRRLLGVITGHFERIGRDIASVERLGPNPAHMYTLWRDRSVQEIVKADPTLRGKTLGTAARLDSLFDFVSGKRAPVVNEQMAKGFDTLRNLMIASRLGSASITALTDEAMLHLTARVNNLPRARLIANELATFNPANQVEKRLALRAGLGLDAMVGEMNRWGSDTLGPSWSSKLSQTIIRASGLEALDSARRRALGVTMYSAIGQLAKDHAKLASLDPHDNRILLSKGLTDANWQTFRAATLEDWGRGPGSDTMLTPDAIARIPDADLQALADREWTTPQALREEAVTKLLAHVLEEGRMVVPAPDIRQRVTAGALLNRGDLKGELTRSFFLFKSFPLAMIQKHLARGLGMPTVGGRAAYIASLIAGTTIMGGIAMEINEFLSGKDPRNLFDPTQEGFYRNWVGAFLKGGSMGIYGDFLFSNENRGGGGALATLEGPLLGLGEEAFNLTQGNAVKALGGEKTNFGAGLIHFAKGITPGANLWYAKAALDHLVFQQLQEYLNPGYLHRMELRAERQYGDRFWWRPGASFDQARAPALTRIAGQ